MSHFDICLKQKKNVLTFFTLPSTQIINVIGLFFLLASIEKLGYKHAFQP